MWMKIHPKHPSKDIGLGIIDEFLSLPNLNKCYVPPKTYKLEQIPTAKHIMEDVTNDETFNHAITMEKHDNVDVKKFLQGWLHMGDRGDPMHGIPYIAMDVQCVSDGGLQACIGGLPKSLESDDVMVCLTEDGRDVSLTDVITPAYTISRPHVDGSGRGQVLLCVYGKKFVFWWQDSDELRKEFGEVHGSSKGDYTRTAVRTWPGVRWTILELGKYVEMMPGTVHGVISAENSAVAGWYILRTKWLENGVYEKMLMWELDLVEKRVKVINEAEEDPNYMLDTIEREMKHWKRWLQSGKLEQESNKKLRLLRDKVQKRIVKLRKEVKESEKTFNS
jgi:hypothetical protein